MSLVCAGSLIVCTGAIAASPWNEPGPRSLGQANRSPIPTATASASRLISVKYLQPASIEDDEAIAGGLANLAEIMAAQHCGEPASLDVVWSLIKELQNAYWTTFGQKIFYLDPTWSHWSYPNVAPCVIVIQAAKTAILFYGFSIYEREPYVLVRSDEISKYYCQYRLSYSFSSASSSTPVNFYGPRASTGCGAVTL
jgi:hypothetical protein